MRKWQDLAAPDDPGSWYAVGNMWPTKRGTYETADGSTGTSYDGNVASTHPVYCWATKNSAGTIKEYLVDAVQAWQFDGSALNGVTGFSSQIPGDLMMAAYGDVVIAVCGAGTTTKKQTASLGNFSALAGAPNGDIICVQSNAVLIFVSSTATYYVSDVGDYTNWSTGEYATRSIIESSGPITAAVPYGNDVYVFKPDAIYRMTYTGGTVKWQTQLAWRGLGVETFAGLVGTGQSKYQAIATRRGIVFNGGKSATSPELYLFDGSSPPIPLNPQTTLTCQAGFVLTYNPYSDVLTVAPTEGSNASGANGDYSGTMYYYYYNLSSDMWGTGYGSAAEDFEATTTFPQSIIYNGVVMGDAGARSLASPKPAYWRYRNITTGKYYRCAPSDPGSSATCFLQTSKIGSSEAKTTFDRLTPQLRRRTDLGTDSASLEMTLFREREDTSAQTTRTISEASDRKRFNLQGGVCSDNFARFKVTWTALDVEVDDFIVKTRPAGYE